MKKFNLFSLVLLVAMTLSSVAFATSPQEACKGDLEKYCPGKKGKERRSCLKENEGKLTEGCKSAIAELKGKIKARGKQIREACKDDLQKFCKDTPRGKGAKIKCLRDNESSLAEACKNALPKKKNKKN